MTQLRFGKIPNQEFLAHTWRGTDLVRDFKLDDAWQPDVQGGPYDTLDTVLGTLFAKDSMKPGCLTRFLFKIRGFMGRLFGENKEALAKDAKPRPIPGCNESFIAERLPEDLKGTSKDFPMMNGMFKEVYRLNDEVMFEASTAPTHVAMLFCLAPRPAGEETQWVLEFAVYTKVNGCLGGLYMKLIDPARRLVVYPSLLKGMAQVWKKRKEKPQ